MNPLQYTSEEMFSSTELIRKSKLVFDKLHKKEIEKAIILRDGKPSFMLLDFAIYEKLMKEYLLLKDSSKDQNISKIKEAEIINEEENTNIPAMTNNQIETSKEIIDELNEKDLEEALAEIDKLDLNINKEEKEPLKEFWE